jgi:hypothetical protein
MWNVGPPSTVQNSGNDDDDDDAPNSIGQNKNQPTPFSIVQVIDDDVEGKFRPVIGGYDSGNQSTNEKYHVAFKLQGTFKFKIRKHPKDPPALVVNVFEEQPVLVQLNDNGFSPIFIKIGTKNNLVKIFKFVSSEIFSYLDEGRSIKWEWNFCKIPHSIYQSEYCDRHNGLYVRGKG